MDEQQRPLLTMCKSRVIEEIPEGLSEKSLALLQTLSSLCSFHSAADLSEFLFSEMFDSLVGNDGPWVVFELGIYRDHNKTIELIAVAGNITLVDSQSSGAFDGDVVQCKTVKEMENIIMQWHDTVFDDGGRFQ